MILLRSSKNPILKPSNNLWENYATFNGSLIKNNDKYVLLYRAMGNEIDVYHKKLRLSVIGKADSTNGIDFANRTIFISPSFEWDKYGCEDPRITFIDNKYFIFYTALSNYPFTHSSIKVGVAISPDLIHITSRHLVTPFNAKAMTMFPEKINGKYTVILTVNTDNPPTNIAIAQFEKIETLWDIIFWENWYKNLDQHIIHLRRVNSDHMEVGATPLATSAGWILIYSYIKHYFGKTKKIFRIESILLDLKNPQKIIGRIENPLLTPEESYEKNGNIPDIVFPEGALIEDKTLKISYGAADTNCAVAEAPLQEFMTSFAINSPGTLKCRKFPHNPLLQPIPEHEWESKSVFNPASFELMDKIYLIYRASSDNNISRLGLAISNDGYLIDERLDEPIYPLRSKFEKLGSEDPRITRIEDTLYMLYTAYDGVLARLAMTSISINDFLLRDWQKWTLPKIISPEQMMDKDGMLFPEKINEKYIVFHRIEPNICIDYIDNLNFSNSSLKTKNIITPHNRSWDEKKIGINTPPLKTKEGWLVFYHGISNIDGHYRVGAFLLDLTEPAKVIGWTPYPILEPETEFEKKGIVDNVVFPCGFVLLKETIYLYYGGADKVVCGATISLNELLEYILNSSQKKYLTYP